MAQNQLIPGPAGATLLAVSTAMLLAACGGSSSDSSNNPDTSVACEASPPYQIGDEGPSGGLIFFVDEDDRHDFTYLEAAPENLPGTTDKLHSWSSQGLDLSGQTAEGIGAGAANTQLILAASDDQDIRAHAAERIDEASLGGCDDWFLPSRDELTLMYENLHDQGLGDFVDDNGFDFWSSSEVGLQYAWGRQFGGGMDGFENEWLKTLRFRVRPARAF